MADPVTPNKGLTVPATGADPNAWGPIVNANMAAIDAYLGTTTNLSISSGTVVVSNSQAQALRMNLSGTLTGAVTIQIPQKPGYFYFHDQTTRGGFAITVTSGATNSRTQNLPARLSHIFSDGANCYLVSEPNHGTTQDFAGGTPPPLWLLCDGSAVSRTTYADLFGAIGTTWGAGDGSTTFNLPDFRGRVTFGADAMGGTAANRLTTASMGAAAALGVVGGNELLQSHTHTDSGHTHTDSGHTHTDAGHTHTDAGHGTPLSQSPHSHSDAGHNHGYSAGSSYDSSGVAGNAATTSYNQGTNGTNTGYANIQASNANISLGTGYANIQTSYANIQTGHAAIQTGNANIQSTGGGASQNVPPAAVVNKIIYAGQ